MPPRRAHPIVLAAWQSVRAAATGGPAAQLAAFAAGTTWRAYATRRPVVWASALVPSELIYGAGAEPFYPELASAILTSVGRSRPAQERAEADGLSLDICSFHRAAWGLDALGWGPAPSLVVAASCPCDGAPLFLRQIAARRAVPFVLVDVPPRDDAAARTYVAGQLAALYREIRFLGRPRSVDLEGALGNSNAARRLWVAVNEARRAVPAPLDGSAALGYVGMHIWSLGHPRGTAFYGALLRRLRQRPRAGAEEARLLWLHLRPYYAHNVGAVLEGRGVMAFEEWSDVYWPPLDERRPFLALAQRLLAHPSNRPLTQRLERLRELIARYRIDGVVHFAHWGCRQATGPAPLLARTLRQEGTPVLILEGDCCDSRNYFPGQLTTRLEAFLEQLQRKGR